MDRNVRGGLRILVCAGRVWAGGVLGFVSHANALTVAEPADSHQRNRSCNSESFAVKDLLFFRVFQNEVTPNQANSTVKHIAATIRLGFALPAWYSAYSR